MTCATRGHSSCPFCCSNQCRAVLCCAVPVPKVETAHALYFYHECGLTGQAPSAKQVSAMRALTNGSGSDLRQWCLKVTQTDMGLL
jgi:hypothetical protein